jgi:pimeloyl-ACP methyl ester carboxylesterase
MVDEYRVFRMPRRPGIHRPTFLLLHGIGLSHRSFTRAAIVLAGRGDVVAIDLPGFGGTRRPKRPLSVEDYACGIADVLDRLGMGHVIAVGHSMGMQFALELAVVRPDLVDGVVMIGPVVDLRYRTLWQQGLRLIRDASREPFRTNLMVQFDYVRCGPAWYLAETRAMLAYSTHERIQQLTKPLLVLRGENDRIADERWAIWLSVQTPGGTYQSIPRQRHNVVHGSPSDTAEQIIHFAQRLSNPAQLPQ